jgi:hypothetical protein
MQGGQGPSVHSAVSISTRAGRTSKKFFTYEWASVRDEGAKQRSIPSLASEKKGIPGDNNGRIRSFLVPVTPGVLIASRGSSSYLFGPRGRFCGGLISQTPPDNLWCLRERLERINI